MLSNARTPPPCADKLSCHIVLSQTQATIESLERATMQNPKHPLRLAFGDNYQPVNAS